MHGNSLETIKVLDDVVAMPIYGIAIIYICKAIKMAVLVLQYNGVTITGDGCP